MAKKIKRIIVIFISTIAIVLVIVCYFYYKKPADIKNSNGKKINAIELYKIFIEGAATAKNYTGKVVEVTGKVAEVFKNQQNQTVILLKTDKENAFINCTMEEIEYNIKTGGHASIKGICNGIGETDTILGIFGDVYLIRCYNSKTNK